MESNCSTRTEEHNDDGEVEEDQEELSLFTVTLEMGPGLNLILCSSMSSFVFLKKGEQKYKKWPFYCHIGSKSGSCCHLANLS